VEYREEGLEEEEEDMMLDDCLIVGRVELAGVRDEEEGLIG